MYICSVWLQAARGCSSVENVNMAREILSSFYQVLSTPLFIIKYCCATGIGLLEHKGRL